ncbi:chemotaxis protein CheW [Sporomusa aerivorans]|uniref:hybrid sensor histidine kinase/response regulator n=1 Tax=Sporomusa aerivorans TaxID=204936 RepID=UPI003529E0A4
MHQDNLFEDFVQEARSYIADMEACLLALEQENYEDDTVNRLFRAVHTIKGTAAFFDLTTIVELTHTLENLLDQLRNRKLPVTSSLVDMLLAVTDFLKQLVNQPAASQSKDIGQVLAQIRSFLAAPEPAPQTLHDAWELWDQLIVESASQTYAESSLPPPAPSEGAQTLPTTSPPPDSSFVLPIVPVAAQPPPEEHAGARGVEDSIRVGVELLNDLLNIAGEMVLSRNQLLKIVEAGGREIPNLELVTRNIDFMTTRLQERVMQARMQPVSHIFSKMPRIVRDLGRKIGKEVDLLIKGETVELDKTIMEGLLEPLTHLVRNAIDHGLEPAEQRRQLGKPLAGRLLLKASHEAGKVIIDVADDGRGIDVEKVARKAIQQGLVEPALAATLETGQILSFLFHPGFSTAEKVSDISGRGVGLDVVKTSIKKLGGKIEIISEQGAGATFRLMMPLTLAIIASIIVESSGQLFALPQVNLKEFVLLQPEESRTTVEFVREHPALYLRNELLPIVRLSRVVGLEENENCPDTEYFRQQNRIFSFLVVKSGYRQFALEVDRIYDSEEILVKPLPPALKDCNWYSGTTVLGDGRIAMILDTENLRVKAGIFLIEEEFAQQNNDNLMAARSKKAADSQRLLLFRCSGGETLGLDLGMVARVEEIQATLLQSIGEHEYVSFRGKSLRVIRPESCLPIKQKEQESQILYLIIPRLIKRPVALIAHEIIDIIDTGAVLDTEVISGSGVIGSTLVAGNMVLLINLYELLELADPAGQPGFLPNAPSTERKIQVLLAEDTPFFARMTKGYLEWAGYDVLLAENGREALKLLDSKPVDIIVSDIEMPVMDGLELVQTIRSDENLRHLPVIALTSLSRPDQRERGLRAGFDLYEVKLDRDTLLESVALLLKKRLKTG